MGTAKRVRWVALGVVVGLAFGGIAYAVVVNPPNAGDRFYACVGTGGVVKSDTLRRNVAPTKCPSRTDTVESWNAVGNTGPTGVTGGTGPTGAPGSGGNTYRTYVGTYTVRHTNTGCAANELRTELIAVAGQAPIEPYGACSALYDTAYLSNGVAPPGGSGAVAVGQSGEFAIATDSSKSCASLTSALGLTRISLEREPVGPNGDPAYSAVLYPNNDLSRDTQSFFASVETGWYPVMASGPVTEDAGNRLCSIVRGHLIGAFPSLVDYRSRISNNLVWSVYRYQQY